MWRSRMTQKAIAAEDKLARRTSILAAARRLFGVDSRQLPSVARIAEAAELAKGTVYLYFLSKEEIFLALLGDEFQALLSNLSGQFGASWRRAGPDGFISLYLAYLEAHPELLRLDAMAYSVLENNLSEQQLRPFKLALMQQLLAAGAVLEQELGLAPGRGATLLLRTYALTRGLWQSLDHPPVLRALLADPVFAPLRPSFSGELEGALREYWRGALA